MSHMPLRSSRTDAPAEADAASGAAALPRHADQRGIRSDLLETTAPVLFEPVEPRILLSADPLAATTDELEASHASVLEPAGDTVQIVGLESASDDVDPAAGIRVAFDRVLRFEAGTRISFDYTITNDAAVDLTGPFKTRFELIVGDAVVRTFEHTVTEPLVVAAGGETVVRAHLTTLSWPSWSILKIPTGERAVDAVLRATMLEVGGSAPTTPSPVVEQAVRVGEFPDLALWNVVMLNNKTAVGGTADIRYRVIERNAEAAVGPREDRVYWSTDDAFDTGDILAGSYVRTEPHRAGQSLYETVEVAAPPAPGLWYLFVELDALGAVGESEIDRRDNVAIAATNGGTKLPPYQVDLPDAPDLRVVEGSISTPSTIVAGNAVTVSWDVENVGQRATTALYWQEKVTLTDADGRSRTVVSNHHGTLSPGEARSRSLDVLVPGDFRGDVSVSVTVNPDGGRRDTSSYYYVAEPGFGFNNTFTLDDAFVATEGRNLEVVSVEGPRYGIAGQNVTVAWTVRNTGPDSTPPGGFWRDDITLSSDDDIGTRNTAGYNRSISQFLDAAGGDVDTYRQEMTFRLPYNVSGDFWIFVTANGGLHIQESTRDDNVGVSLAFPVTVYPPDLTVHDVEVANVLISDTDATFAWTTRNDGTGFGGSRNVHETVYVSASPTFDASAIAVGSIVTTDNLAPGASARRVADFRLPQGLDGTFYVFVFVDRTDNVNEFGADNNNTAVARNALGAPKAVTLLPRNPVDLEVTSVTLDRQSAVSGDPVRVTATIENRGGSDADDGTWQDRVYLSADATLDGSDRLLGTRSRSFLATDDGYTVTFDVDVPPETRTGEYHLIVVADAGEKVFELDRDNNVRSTAGTLSVTLEPANLTVGPVEASAPVVQAGTQLALSYVVTNAGTGPTYASSWSDRIYLRRADGSGGSDVLLATHFHTARLEAGASRTVARTVTVPVTLDGHYSLFVVADHNDLVVEVGGETDNTSAGTPLEIVQEVADLRVADVAIGESSILRPGGRLDLSWTVENVGQGQTNRTDWSDRVLLVPDDGRDPILLANISRSGAALAAGATQMTTASLALPQSLDPFGRYAIRIEADASDRVFEGVDAAGNERTTEVVQLGDRLRPDLRVEDVVAPGGIAYGGDDITLAWTVTNHGEAAVDSFKQQVYLSRDGSLSDTDILVSSQIFVGVLAPGQSQVFDRSFNLPVGLTGDYRIIVQVGDPGVAFETNLTDNVSTAPQVQTLAPNVPVDLRVTAIDGIVPTTAGDLLSLSYTIMNDSTHALPLMTRHHSVYLSADATYDVGDVLFATVSETANLAAGQSRVFDVEGYVSNLMSGDYHVLFRADVANAIVETDESNNLFVAPERLSVTMPSVGYGDTVVGTIPTEGATQYFRIEVGAGEAFRTRLRVDGDFGEATVRVAHERIPVAGRADASGELPDGLDQTAVIPATEAGTYVIAVSFEGGQAARTFELTVEELSFEVLGVSADTLGNTGAATVVVKGTLFDDATVFVLDGPAGLTILPAFAEIVDSGTARLTYMLAGAPAGDYTLAAIRGGEVATYPTPITVVDGFAAKVTGGFRGPDTIVNASAARVDLYFRNTGGSDTLAPLFMLEEERGAAIGIDGVARAGLPVLVMGVPLDGPVNLLSPNQVGQLSVVVSDYGHVRNAPLALNANPVTAEDTREISQGDWARLKKALQPDDVTSEDWTEYWKRQQPVLGETWGDFVRVLNSLMVSVSGSEARPVQDVREVFARLYAADGDVMPSVSGTLVDSLTGAPLEGVEVTLYAVTPDAEGFYRVGGSALTDAAGRFVIERLWPGEEYMLLPAGYDVDADGDGLADASQLSVLALAGIDVEIGRPIGVLSQDRDPGELEADEMLNLVTDDAGTTHAIWKRGPNILHAIATADGWGEATVIASGFSIEDVTAVFSPRLLDDTAPGLLVSWAAEGDLPDTSVAQRNLQEIFVAVARYAADGTLEWSSPQVVTQDTVEDRRPSLTVIADGDVLMTYLKTDAAAVDDTDLYYIEFDLEEASFAFPAAAAAAQLSTQSVKPPAQIKVPLFDPRNPAISDIDETILRDLKEFDSWGFGIKQAIEVTKGYKVGPGNSPSVIAEYMARPLNGLFGDGEFKASFSLLYDTRSLWNTKTIQEKQKFHTWVLQKNGTYVNRALDKTGAAGNFVSSITKAYNANKHIKINSGVFESGWEVKLGTKKYAAKVAAAASGIWSTPPGAPKWTFDASQISVGLNAAFQDTRGLLNMLKLIPHPAVFKGVDALNAWLDGLKKNANLDLELGLGVNVGAAASARWSLPEKTGDSERWEVFLPDAVTGKVALGGEVWGQMKLASKSFSFKNLGDALSKGGKLLSKANYGSPIQDTISLKVSGKLDAEEILVLPNPLSQARGIAASVNIEIYILGFLLKRSFAFSDTFGANNLGGAPVILSTNANAQDGVEVSPNGDVLIDTETVEWVGHHGSGLVHPGQSLVASVASDVANDGPASTVLLDDGRVLAVWTRETAPLRNEIVWSVYDGSSWSLPETGPSVAGVASNLSVAKGHDGRISLVYGEAAMDAVDSDSPDLTFEEIAAALADTDVKHAFFDGHAWTSPVQLADTEYGDAGVKIAAGPDGSLTVAWVETSNPAAAGLEAEDREYEDVVERIWTARHDGTAWSAPEVHAEALLVTDLELAEGPSGPLLAWSGLTLEEMLALPDDGTGAPILHLATLGAASGWSARTSVLPQTPAEGEAESELAPQSAVPASSDDEALNANAAIPNGGTGATDDRYKVVKGQPGGLIEFVLVNDTDSPPLLLEMRVLRTDAGEGTVPSEFGATWADVAGSAVRQLNLVTDKGKPLEAILRGDGTLLISEDALARVTADMGPADTDTVSFRYTTGTPQDALDANDEGWAVVTVDFFGEEPPEDSPPGPGYSPPGDWSPWGPLVTAAIDPNEIHGPAGVGAERWVAPDRPLGYTVLFENLPEALVPARTVTIEQQLDPDLDVRSIRFGDIGWGDIVVDVPDGATFVNTRVDLRDTRGVFVDVRATVDAAAGRVIWILSAVDPVTGDTPLDATVGFLPPNRAAAEGEGFVTYSILPKSDLSHGTLIDAQASIVFDSEAPFLTNTHRNAIDAAAPAAAIVSAVETATGDIQIAWAGSDVGSGVVGYTVYVSANGGPLTAWLDRTSETSASLPGESGATYAIYLVAEDAVGNRQAVAGSPDALITISGAAEGRLAGELFVDRNGNASRDPGEAARGDAIVFLDTDGDAELDPGERSVVATSSGSWSFEGLLSGQHAVVAVSLGGTFLGAGAISIAPGETVDGLDLPAFEPGRITGVVFDDLDGDGVRDAGEKVASDFLVFVDANGDGAFNAGELSTRTGSDGSYVFSGLAAGLYAVGPALPAGRLSTDPSGASHRSVAITSGADVVADFGTVAPGMITGTLFEDRDGDGIRDEGERGLIGWSVFLDTDGDGTKDAGEREVRTNGNGVYQFDGLLPGTYRLVVVPAAGWTFTADASRSGEGPTVLHASVGGTGGGTTVAEAGETIGLGAVRAEFPSTTGAGHAVVVIDTGIDADHPFFGPDADGDGVADRIVYQWDFVDGDAVAEDNIGHGTHVAGIIAGQHLVHDGVAPGADIIALKAVDTGSNGFVALEQALQWTVQNAAAYDIRVVNLSLGDGLNWDAPVSLYGLGDELAALAALGITVVAAAGNGFYTFDSELGVSYPAADPNVLAVGAVWSFAGGAQANGGAVEYSTVPGQVAAVSQRHPELLDALAPGMSIVSAAPGGGTASLSGTSQSAAIVSGIAILAQDLAFEHLGRTLDPAEFAGLVRESGVLLTDGDDEADNVDNSGASFTGIDALALLRAIKALDPEAAPAPTPAVPSVSLQAHQGQVVAVAPAAVVKADFGLFKPAAVGGTVYVDLDGDGARDAGEAAPGGMVVFLDVDRDGMLSDGDVRAETASDGTFRLADVGPGAFALGIVPVRADRPIFWAGTTTVLSRTDVTDLDIAVDAATIESAISSGELAADLRREILNAFEGGETDIEALKALLASYKALHAERVAARDAAAGAQLQPSSIAATPSQIADTPLQDDVVATPGLTGPAAGLQDFADVLTAGQAQTLLAEAGLAPVRLDFEGADPVAPDRAGAPQPANWLHDLLGGLGEGTGATGADLVILGNPAFAGASSVASGAAA